ncbi:MAG: hypothetical protein H7124_04970 [Phycisphaerales bacterium]|nr:hypothetical protein [Hyphomonadaceae bacterium]
MAPDVFVIRMVLAGAVALMVCGAAAAWVSANALKRVAGGVIALVGAMIALAALQAPTGLLVAGAAVAFAHTALGVAIAVRVQEAYGAVEAPEIDQADRQDDSAGRAP